MKQIQGQYGASEIEIVDDSKRVIVWVWDKQTVSGTIGRYSLQDPRVTDDILERPAKCPRCTRDILEKTLIEPA
jgi:hypothetical protein